MRGPSHDKRDGQARHPAGRQITSAHPPHPDATSARHAPITPRVVPRDSLTARTLQSLPKEAKSMLHAISRPYRHTPSESPPLSPLMGVVTRACCAVAAQGAVAPDAMLTHGSRVERLLLEPINIFWHMRQQIAGARREVLLQTFSWHDASWGAGELRAGLLDLARRRPCPPVAVHLMLRWGPAVGVAAQDHHALRCLIAGLDP